MFEAQYLFGGNSVYSPWMSRGGDNMIATIDLIASSTSEITVELYQKNSEDTGDGFPHPYEESGSFPSPTKIMSGTTPGQSTETFEGVMELVRYKITASSSGNARALFRMLSPVWFDDVSAGS